MLSVPVFLKINQLYLNNTGEEAVAVGICSVMRPIDTVCGAYRCHGWTHLMGASELGVLAELAGRKSGCGRGKGGSMHMYTPRLFGGNGIVGATVSSFKVFNKLKVPPSFHTF